MKQAEVSHLGRMLYWRHDGFCQWSVAHSLDDIWDWR
jgi:hypothetical protein